MNLRNRYGALPRSGKWLAWLVAFLVLFFGVIDPYLGTLNKLNDESGRIEARLRERATLKEKLANNRAMLDAGIVAFGAAELAKSGGTSDDRLGALDRRISAVLANKQAVEKRRLTRENIPNLSYGGSPGDTSGTSTAQRVLRFGKELQIECDTAELMMILRELETAPEVSAVSRVDVRRISDVNPKTGGGTLAVTMVVETWTLASDDANAANGTVTGTPSVTSPTGGGA